LERDFLKRFLSVDEIESLVKVESIAGYWASKEAVAKALRCGIGRELSFLDIKIYKDINNSPYFKLSDRVSRKFRIKESSLSISHDGNFAIAVVVLILM